MDTCNKSWWIWWSLKSLGACYVNNDEVIYFGSFCAKDISKEITKAICNKKNQSQYFQKTSIWLNNM